MGLKYIVLSLLSSAQRAEEGAWTRLAESESSGTMAASERMLQQFSSFSDEEKHEVLMKMLKLTEVSKLLTLLCSVHMKGIHLFT